MADEKTEFEVGSTYLVRHSRKGEITLQVTSIDGEWLTGVLVAGRPKMMNPDNNVDQGESMTVRIAFLTLLEKVEAADA